MSTYSIQSEIATQQLAKKLATICPDDQRIIFFLNGHLGTGKTTFARFFLYALGYQGIVKSPTYTLVEPYQLLQYHVFHLDLYRLTSPEEVVDLGIQDDFDLKAIWLIEWPERAQTFLPTPDLNFTFLLTNASRKVKLQAPTLQGQQLLNRL